MHAGKKYSVIDMARWTRRESLLFLLLAIVPPALASLNLTPPHVPWQPVLLLGTAVAFMTGFKSNAAYDRLWEARQIWGGIVNTSRTWAVMVTDFLLTDTPQIQAARSRLVHRHIAWLTALRYQLRESRVWETIGDAENVEFLKRNYAIPERGTPLESALQNLLSDDERAHVLAKKNRATHIVALQSADLRALVTAGHISEMRHVELERTLSQLYDHQGRCERIKNFPYPRHFSTMNFIFMWMFIFSVPYGLYTELNRVATSFYWLTVPMSFIVQWSFHSMDKIGRVTENPFEGGANDVPITAMARTIEIDLRELLGEKEIPPALQPQHDILL